jgi:predicted permease
VGIAVLGVRALVALGSADLPRPAAIQVDAAALLLAAGVTLLVGVGVGILPALQAAGSDPQAGLQSASLRTVGGSRRLRDALVVAEVSLALVLLAGSGLLLKSLVRLLAVSPGFAANGVLTLRVQTSGHRFDDDAVRRRFFAAALEAVRRVPGVRSAALTNMLPLSGDFDAYGVHLEGGAPLGPSEDESALRYSVSPGWFETLRIPLRRGRLFDERDREDAPLVALVSESFARRRLRGLDPIGRRLRIGASDSAPYTIVGVVGDVRQASLALAAPEAVYTTEAQWHYADGALSFAIRAQGDAASLAPSVRRAIWSVDKDEPIVRVKTLDAVVAASEAQRRFVLVVFEAFALAALVLAAAGIFGVLAGAVAERTREIGVRAALGAAPRALVGLVVRQGLAMTGAGAAIGLAAALAATQALASMLFGVSPLDPVTYLAVVALLASVALLACAVPAWRAARVDPAVTLREG